MGRGYLKIRTVAANGAGFVGGASIAVSDENNTLLYQLTTDEYGNTKELALDAPDRSYMMYPDPPVRPFALYKVTASAYGYIKVIHEGVMIFDTLISLLEIELSPVVIGREDLIKRIPAESHKLYNTTLPQQAEGAGMDFTPFILPEVRIPNNIRVHLGSYRDASAPTVTVPFTTYIKNVVSHEIYDDWPLEAIKANLYCIISLTLNRIYTEMYRKEGYNFDITSYTNRDHKYEHGGIIKARFSQIVDEMFNNGVPYLAVIGHKEPFLSLYNDGHTANYPGRLSQWGSRDDGLRGMTAWQIIKNYYSQNLELRVSTDFGGVLESYPGYTLTLGSRGDAVRTMQLFLNRINGLYTSSYIINPVDGIFGNSTQNAVLFFQGNYNLSKTGNIDRVTWYKISQIYAIEKALWEMYSEGQRIGIGRTPPTQVVRLNDRGALIVELQFLLDFISMYHSEIPFVAQTSVFDALTREGVLAFQRLFAITADGIVGATTWRWLYDVYWGIMENTNVGGGGGNGGGGGTNPNIPQFPGTSLRVGSTGSNVRIVQEAINKLAEVTPGLWRIAADGIFGNGTRDAVMAFQRIFGLTVDGIVGPNTWRRLMEEAYMSSSGGGTTPNIPPFPGNLSVGSSGQNVRLVQEAINKIAPYHPGRLWQLTVDGSFGNMTRDAIFAIQSIFGLPITGVVNQATWNRLMQEAANVSSRSTQLIIQDNYNVSNYYYNTNKSLDQILFIMLVARILAM